MSPAVFERIDRLIERGDAFPRDPGAKASQLVFAGRGGSPPIPLVWQAYIFGKARYYSKRCCALAGPFSNNIAEYPVFYGWRAIESGRSYENFNIGPKIVVDQQSQCYVHDINWPFADSQVRATFTGNVEDPSLYCPGFAVNVADFFYYQNWDTARWTTSGVSQAQAGPWNGPLGQTVLMSFGYFRGDLPIFTICRGPNNENMEPRPARWMPYFSFYHPGVYTVI